MVSNKAKYCWRYLKYIISEISGSIKPCYLSPDPRDTYMFHILWYSHIFCSPLVWSELDTWLMLEGRCPLSSLTHHRSHQLHIRNAKLVAVAVNILTDFRRSIFQFLIDQHWCQVIKQVQIQARPKVLRPGVTSLAEIKSQWWRMYHLGTCFKGDTEKG